MKDREQFQIPREILWLRIMYLPCLSKISTPDGLLGWAPHRKLKTVGPVSITHSDLGETETDVSPDIVGA